MDLILAAKKGLSLRVVMERAKNPAKLLDGPGPATKDEKAANHSGRRIAYGENADYLTARIARDRPDILERMKQGEFTSVRKAAIEAGIVNAKTVNRASEIRLRAERRLGELLRETPKAKGTEYGGKQKKIDGSCLEPSKATPTLADSGISKKLSSRDWRRPRDDKTPAQHGPGNARGV